MSLPLKTSAIALLAILLNGCALPGKSQPPASPPARTAQAGTGQGDTRDDTSADDPGAAVAVDAAQAGSRGSIPEDKLPEVAMSPPMLFELLTAEISLQRDQLSTSYNILMTLARKTRDPRLARRATEVALSGRALDEALDSARLWVELLPDAPDAQRTLETLQLASGRLVDAEPALERRLDQARKNGTLPQTYQRVQGMVARIPDRKAARSLILRLSKPDLGIPEARLLRAALAREAGDDEAATAEARAALALAPDNASLVLRATQLLTRNDPQDESASIGILKDYLGRHPDSADALNALGTLYLFTRQPAEARTLLEGVPAATLERNPQMLFMLGQARFQTGDLKAARESVDQYLALPSDVPHDPAAGYLFRAQIAQKQDDLPRAIADLGRIEDGNLFIPAVSQRALLMGRTGDVDGARRLLQTTRVTEDSDRDTLLSAEASVLRNAGRHQDAFKLLDAALRKDPENTTLLYDHALAAERIDRLATTERSLRKLIQLKPEEPHAYNALGYTLADRNRKLPEALKLIRKAQSLSPDDPQIQDSLGWVYYRMGRLTDALKELQAAYAAMRDVEIAAHLGEVLWKKGDKDEATRIWREGLALDKTNDALLNTLKRFKVDLQP